MRYTEYVERKFPPFFRSTDKFDSFFFFFSPLFFEQRRRSADPASPCRVRSVFVCPEGWFSAETNLSNSVQKLFTHCGAECGILTLSAREAAIPKLTTYRSFYFSFFTPFYFVNDGKRPELVPPRAGVFFCPFAGKCALIVASALLRIFQRLFKNGSHIGAGSAIY